MDEFPVRGVPFNQITSWIAVSAPVWNMTPLVCLFKSTCRICADYKTAVLVSIVRLWNGWAARPAAGPPTWARDGPLPSRQARRAGAATILPDPAPSASIDRSVAQRPDKLSRVWATMNQGSPFCTSWLCPWCQKICSTWLKCHW